MKSYRSGILDFCGSDVSTQYDENGDEGKQCFMKFENGVYKQIPIIKTKHPNIVKGVIVGKKSWGLWRNEWTDGIVEGSFSKREILQQFTDNNIEIPESLMTDFNNTIHKKISKRLIENI